MTRIPFITRCRRLYRGDGATITFRGRTLSRRTLTPPRPETLHLTPRTTIKATLTHPGESPTLTDPTASLLATLTTFLSSSTLPTPSEWRSEGGRSVVSRFSSRGRRSQSSIPEQGRVFWVKGAR